MRREEIGMAVWTIRAEYDPEARVWWTAECDVPGLVTEAETLEQMAAKLKVMVAEMVEENAAFIPEDRRAGPHEFRLIAHYEMQDRAAA
jgi:predicted RNase H-like HicB family nuclease